MSLEKLIPAFDDVAFAPRTLHLSLPADLAGNLSLHGRGFLNIAFGAGLQSIHDLTGDAWTRDNVATNFFFRGSVEDQLEILAFLTVFVHEYTHRIDFLISPFGLHYYIQTLREYFYLQELVPPILDDPKKVERMQFLVGFDAAGDVEDNMANEWLPLKEIIHLFYAWGDASSVTPLGKYIKEGWGKAFTGPADPFGVGVLLEPVTVADTFETFRIPERDRFWYLRPLTIFETKAVVNSLLFIQHLLGERAGPLCRLYYERLYLARKQDLPADYFFLLDLGARMYRRPDFETLLRTGSVEMIRSLLLMLSSICWFALQAPPPLKGDNPRVANPILRLILAFNFFAAYATGKLNVSFSSTAEGLKILESTQGAAALHVKPIRETLATCTKVIDHFLRANRERTWNPQVKSHFEHVFTLMRPHFAAREPDYVSFLGMPDKGNPLLECATDEDWELTYTDYETPADVAEWFELRTDLFFKMLKPSKEILHRLDQHYLAFLIPYACESCNAGMTWQWASRFAESYTLRCAFCKQSKVLSREEMTPIRMPAGDVDSDRLV